MTAHDPALIYSVSRVLTKSLCAQYPQYEYEERRRGREQIAPYPGVLFVYERDHPGIDATIVTYEKVPLSVAARRWERERAARAAQADGDAQPKAKAKK